MTVPTEQRQSNGTVLGAFLAAARRQGHFESIQKKAPPALAGFINRPYLAMTPVPGSLLDEFYVTTVQVAGPAALRAIARDAFHAEVARLLKPVIENTFTLYGRRAANLFEQVSMVTAPMTRGYQVTFRPESPQSGWICVRPDDQPNPLSFILWEALMEYFFDAAGESGTVGTAELHDNGREGRVRVSW